MLRILREVKEVEPGGVKGGNRTFVNLYLNDLNALKLTIAEIRK